MILRKLVILILATFFLNGCAQNAALLAPAYTIASSGNIYHAGLTVSSNEIIVRATGKSTAHNDTPGVMLSSAAKEYLKVYGVLVGKKPIIFTNNDSGYETAIEFKKNGVENSVIFYENIKGTY